MYQHLLVFALFGFTASSSALFASPASLVFVQVAKLSATPMTSGQGDYDVRVSGKTTCNAGEPQELHLYPDPDTRLVRVVALAERHNGTCTAKDFELRSVMYLEPGPWTISSNHGHKTLNLNVKASKENDNLSPTADPKLTSCSSPPQDGPFDVIF